MCCSCKLGFSLQWQQPLQQHKLRLVSSSNLQCCPIPADVICILCIISAAIISSKISQPVWKHGITNTWQLQSFQMIIRKTICQAGFTGTTAVSQQKIINTEPLTNFCFEEQNTFAISPDGSTMYHHNFPETIMKCFPVHTKIPCILFTVLGPLAEMMERVSPSRRYIQDCSVVCAILK